MTLSNFFSFALLAFSIITAVIFFIRQNCEIERIEKKLDAHIEESFKRNLESKQQKSQLRQQILELRELIEEVRVSAKRHSDNNAEGIKQFIKELSIKEIKETLTNES